MQPEPILIDEKRLNVNVLFIVEVHLATQLLHRHPSQTTRNQLVIYKRDRGVPLRRIIEPIYLMVKAGIGTSGCGMKHATSGLQV